MGRTSGKFSFYDQLSKDKKKKYDLMLETNYLLLRCDECSFIEHSPKGVESYSTSWLLSLRPVIKKWCLDDSTYPQGSISANRLCYDALRSFLGKEQFNGYKYKYIRDGLVKLIVNRRDNRTKLFGSSFRVIETKGTFDPKSFKEVDVNLRHSAAALYILCNELQRGVTIPRLLDESLEVFFEELDKYLHEQDNWNSDNYKHATLAAIMYLCCLLSDNDSFKRYKQVASDVYEDCLKKLLTSENCVKFDIINQPYWIMPNQSIQQKAISNYEYYFNLGVLILLPQIMEYGFAQIIIRRMIDNRVETADGYGIPLKDAVKTKPQLQEPDFGTSASILYLLWYSLFYEVSTKDWQIYCRDNFYHILDFCLNAYDKPKYYSLQYNENNCRVLFLPRYNRDKSRLEEIDHYIEEVKRSIANQLQSGKGKLKTKGVKAPIGLEHIHEIINLWEISQYWIENKHLKTEIDYSKVGEFLGGLFIGALKASSR